MLVAGSQRDGSWSKMKEFTPFSLDGPDQRLWRDGQRVPLTPKAFSVPDRGHCDCAWDTRRRRSGGACWHQRSGHDVLVTAFYGARQGPVVALTAGVHGYECAPILADQQLRDRIDPATLAGTVVLVRLAHVAAFEQRVPFVNPFDRKNLNRVFPGVPDGTQTERIAWTLTTEVIRRADLHVELHSGDGAEWLEAFAGAYGDPLADSQYAMSRRMALAFGFRNFVKYSMRTQAQVDRGRSLNRQAVADDTPTVLIEIGENGRQEDGFVVPVVNGVENLLRELRMTTGPAATAGRPVRAGELLGTIVDYRGTLVATVVAPIDGYVLYGIAGPPVVAGDTVATIGRPAASPL